MTVKELEDIKRSLPSVYGEAFRINQIKRLINAYEGRHLESPRKPRPSAVFVRVLKVRCLACGCRITVGVTRTPSTGHWSRSCYGCGRISHISLTKQRGLIHVELMAGDCRTVDQTRLVKGD